MSIADIDQQAEVPWLEPLHGRAQVARFRHRADTQLHLQAWRHASIRV